MDLVHHIYSLVLQGKLHQAPIGNNPQRVLDLGTGTGIWAIDFADEYPSAEVIGTDLSPIQPDWTPPNCFFEVDDFQDDWVYKKPFDFIHARELEGCIADDEKLFQQAFDSLNPGGYFELQAQRGCFMSDDGTAENATVLQSWAANILESSEKFGKPIDCAHKWKEVVERVGFVDVHEEVRKIPIGPWPKDPALKEIGKCQLVQSSQAIESYTPKLFGDLLGWSTEEIEVMIAQAKNELKDRSIHLYLPVYIIWGRKP
ncbi:S-adenosyl-L-methionine-dependent methyltransferase [Dactylonectria estremocensis]|uniref:S-adenosyl-L-methionine-dependent methyltransferase n=1 Tax=Dactylonectria estremocensis TaxID=1079267 RepID=A0A9P9E2C6_9HYPO|nr:S-adenosyl-L-methionine-dependent methyltransferase [Dactylonectria estremocensis]